MTPVSDPSGFIAECVSGLIKIGFDADTFETAKWTGLACLIFLGLTILGGFATKVFKAVQIDMPLSDTQFKWLLLVGAALVALPVVAKVTSDQFNVNFQSEDRIFAQRICEEQLEATAKTAEIGALEARLASVEAILNPEPTPVIEIDPNDPSTAGVQPPPKPMANPELLGRAVSVFYRTDQAEAAQRVAALLKQVGAGVALRETDLTETNYSKQAISGEIVLLYDPSGSLAAQAVESELKAAGISVRTSDALSALKGNSVQILMF